MLSFFTILKLTGLISRKAAKNNHLSWQIMKWSLKPWYVPTAFKFRIGNRFGSLPAENGGTDRLRYI